MAAFTDNICHIILTRYVPKATSWAGPSGISWAFALGPTTSVAAGKTPPSTQDSVSVGNRGGFIGAIEIHWLQIKEKMVQC